MDKKSTGRLLKVSTYVEKFINENKVNLSLPELHEYLNKLLLKKAYSRVDFIKRAGIDRSYAYNILSGQKNTSRDKPGIIAIAMKIHEAQSLLEYCGYRELYVCGMR